MRFGSTPFFFVLTAFISSCGTKPAYTDKDAQVRQFLAKNGIVSCTAYETDCDGKNKLKASQTQYNSSGEEVSRISYFMGGDIFSNTRQEYENGLMTQKTYLKTNTNPFQVVRYEYNEKGQKIKYAIFDSLDNRLSLHKIEHKGNKEYISDYDGKGSLTNYRTIAYDSLDHPLVFGSKKIRYTYNKNGLQTEMASVDTITGLFERIEYQYKDLLLVNMRVYYNDTCRSVFHYEYQKDSGEKW